MGEIDKICSMTDLHLNIDKVSNSRISIFTDRAVALCMPNGKLSLVSSNLPPTKLLSIYTKGLIREKTNVIPKVLRIPDQYQCDKFQNLSTYWQVLEAVEEITMDDAGFLDLIEANLSIQYGGLQMPTDQELKEYFYYTRLIANLLAYLPNLTVYRRKEPAKAGFRLYSQPSIILNELVIGGKVKIIQGETKERIQYVFKVYDILYNNFDIDFPHLATTVPEGVMPFSLENNINSNDQDRHIGSRQLYIDQDIFGNITRYRTGLNLFSDGAYTRFLRVVKNTHWSEHVTNETLYNGLEKLSVIDKHLRLKFYGHCVRSIHICFQPVSMIVNWEGQTKLKRGKGPTNTYKKVIMEQAKLEQNLLALVVFERQEWSRHLSEIRSSGISYF